MKVRMNNPLASAVHKIKRAKAKLEAQKTSLEQELVTENGERVILSCDAWTNMAKGVTELDNCSMKKIPKTSEQPSCAVIQEKD